MFKGLLGPVLTAEEKRSIKVYNLTFCCRFLIDINRITANMYFKVNLRVKFALFSCFYVSTSFAVGCESLRKK